MTYLKTDLKILVPLPELLGQGEGKEHCTDCKGEATWQLQGNHALLFKRPIPQFLCSVEIRA